MHWGNAKATAAAPQDQDTAPEEERVEERRAVFRQAQLTLEDWFKISAVIIELSESGARIRYANRVDLPSRLRICEPTLKLNRWARVVWQRDCLAGLEFVETDDRV
ncbi:MAG: PilZ domain-containing protein [Alphaproteobacteria bacterium]